MKQNKKYFFVLLMGLVLVGELWGQSEWRLHQMARHTARHNAARLSPEARAAWPQDNKKLAKLWLAREQRDVTPELLKLLQGSSHPGIRSRTLKALGRLENPGTLRPLQAWQKKLTEQEKERLSPTLALALSRIQSHNLRGQKKLDAVAKSVNLSWGEVVRLSQKVNAPKAYAQGTLGDQVVDELVDVIYHMVKRGESLDKFVAELSIAPAQRALIHSGSLPDEKQVEFLIDYLNGVNVEQSNDSELARQYLLSLPKARELLVRYLQKFSQNPEAFIRRSQPQMPRLGYSFLFEAAALTDDKRVPLLLEVIARKTRSSYDKNPDVNANPYATVYVIAIQSLSAAKGKRVPSLP